MNIQEFRQKYPEYNDMPDKDLADKFHGKYYSDIPKDEFYTKFGVSSEKPTSGIDEGFLQKSLSSAKSGVEQYLSLMGKNPGMQPRLPGNSPLPLAQNLAAGFGQGSQNFFSTISGGNIPMANPNDWEASFGIGRETGIPEKIAQGIGTYLPYGVAAGASIPLQIAAGGLHGLSQGRPGQENLMGLLPEGKLGATIEGAGLNALAGGVAKAIEAVRPSKVLRGNLSDEELIANAKAAEGTTTGLGDVIGSPFLKKQYENLISKIPFSGANAKMQQAGQAVENKGNQILSNLLGENNPTSINDRLSESLIKQFETRQRTKNTLYNDVNKIADESNLQMELPTFANKANQYSGAIEDTKILKYEPEIKNIFDKLQNYKNATNTGTGYPTLQEANLLKAKLNQYANTAKQSPDPTQRHLGNVYGKLASSLKTDINATIDASGNIPLKTAYRKAEDNYAKNFSPFLDKQIYKFISGKADPDTLVASFLSQSKTSDRGKMLSKLVNQLPDEEKPLVGYAYLSRAVNKEGNLNPGKLNTLIDKLGKNQFEALIPDPIMRKSLQDYSRLYGMNTKAVNLMQNPATGQQALDLLPAFLAHAGGSLLGGATGGWEGALAGLILPGLAARPIANKLTSGKTRENLIKAMLANKPLNLPVQQTQAVLQGLNQ